MSKFIMLMGLPASGKSTYAEQLLTQEPNAVLVSTDMLRLELFGSSGVDVQSSERNQILFAHVRELIVESLKCDDTVIPLALDGGLR